MEECTRSPNLSIIEEKSKELNLSQKTITKAKYLATEYFKKTIKIPTHPEALIPSFLYIAAIITGERRTQAQLEEVFKTSSLTIRKWNMHIDKEIGTEISADIMTEVYGKCCYIRLTRVTTYEFLDILNYKSYHKKNATIRYVDVVKAMRNGNAIIRTAIGFAPLLLRYLREKDIQHLIIDKIEDELKKKEG